MAKIAYLRCSTTHQNLDRQEYSMPGNIDKTFSEKVSGKNTDRPELQRMLDYIREGDVVYFESFSRLSRSLPDLLSLLDTFEKKGVKWVSLKENIDTTGATGRLIISLLGAISAYEREINAERREYGYSKALQEKRVGRPSVQPTDQFLNAYAEWQSGKITASKAITKSGTSRTTFYKLVKMQKKGVITPKI